MLGQIRIIMFKCACNSSHFGSLADGTMVEPYTSDLDLARNLRSGVGLFLLEWTKLIRFKTEKIKYRSHINSPGICSLSLVIGEERYNQMHSLKATGETAEIPFSLLIFLFVTTSENFASFGRL